jgi:hypothetical protein
MSCRAWQDLLQQHLDDAGPPGALARHLHDCPDCAARRGEVERLLRGLAQLHRPEPPAALADRLTSRLGAEVRARRARAWRRLVPRAGLAVAAAVLVALSLWSWWPIVGQPRAQKAPPADPGEKQRRDESPPGPPRDPMAEAGQAVASLGQRTASTTLDRTTTLLPLVRDPALDPLNVPAPAEPKLEPLREAADGVSAGLAPVADSARRAVNLFFRDLPMGRPEAGNVNNPG